MKRTKNVERLIETTIETCLPEKIILVGVYEYKEHSSHIGIGALENSVREATYDLLVLVNHQTALDSLTDRLEERAKILGKVTAVVYPLSKFNALLEYGHPFAIKLLESGGTIYDSHVNPYSEFGIIDKSLSPYPGKKDYFFAIDRAEEFLATVHLHIIRKEYIAASFALHQAAEQLYIGGIKRASILSPPFRAVLSHIVSHKGGFMDYLLKRKDAYYFNRRVPSEYTEYDKRRFVRLSLKTDSLRDATRLAHKQNLLLENHWRNLASGGLKHIHTSYEGIVNLAKLLGFVYAPNSELAKLPTPQLLERLLEAEKRIDNEPEVSAILGGIPVPGLFLNEILAKFFHYTKADIWNKSVNQVRKWENPRKLAMRTFINCVGNKEVKDLTKDDIIKYRDWWISRVEFENMDSRTANRNLIHVKSIITTVNEHMNLNIDTDKLFRKITLKTPEEEKRHPFETSYIVSTILNASRLAGLNPQAKWALYAMSETGASVSELVGLLPENIHLDCEIPFIEIVPHKKKVLKTKYRKRTIPLVGFALEAFQAVPKGFTNYCGNPDSLSATLGKYLKENGLFPSDKHTVYSLRHSFQDRLLAVNAPDRVQADLMGHKFNRPSYGDGTSQLQKVDWLGKIKLKQD